MNRRAAIKNATTTIVGIGVIPGFSALLQRCGVERTTGYQPQYLTVEQYDTVWQIARLIIPSTDTPGADEAGVAQYIDLVVGEFLETQETEDFHKGLNDLITLSSGTYDKKFTKLDEVQQLELLNSLESGSDEFVRSLKEMVIWAYFTSEPGMRSLNYVPVPGRYNGCIQIDASEKVLVGNR